MADASFGERPNDSMWTALRTQTRVVSALVLREVRTRFGESKIGYAWALIEQIGHIFALMGIYIILGRRSPVGQSLLLFFITGLMPYMMYEKVATRVCSAISGNKALLNLPTVKNFDVMLSRAILEGATLLVVFGLMLGVLVAVGVEEARPIYPLTLAAALGATWLLGLGVGIVNAMITVVYKSWDHVFRIVTRPLYIASGVFFMVEHFPPPISTYLLYNPVLHGVEWTRAAFYEGYGRFSIDRGYLLMWAIISTMAGLALEKRLRKKIMVT